MSYLASLLYIITLLLFIRAFREGGDAYYIAFAFLASALAVTLFSFFALSTLNQL